MRRAVLLLVLLPSLAAALPDGYWSAAQRRDVLDKMQTIELAPPLGSLTAGESVAVEKLVAAGAIVQRIYEAQRHPEAARSLAALQEVKKEDPTAYAELADLYRLFQGPIANTPQNTREAFLPVAPVAPGKGFYPWGISRAELDAWLEGHPAQRDDLLAPRTVVRRATRDNVRADLAVLKKHPVLDVLHPGLHARLDALRGGDDAGFYAVPYSVAWADDTLAIYGLLNEAAEAVQADDAELAGYFRNRARDFLSDDYESGDASWVTSRFQHLNAQIGSYETYEDELYGTKAAISLSVLKLREAETAKLRAALSDLQAIEDALPYASDRKVRSDIPVGIYDVVADFGQARGSNTASILPNDALHAQRYGRTILLRANIMEHEALAALRQAAWRAAVAPAHADELVAGAGSNRTLWHEIGHYLGVDRTSDGRDIDAALLENADAYEELKADLVALHAAKQLRASGFYDDATLQALYASAVARATLLQNKPRRDQPYQTMQLMQWNYFMEQGYVGIDAQQRLTIDYTKAHGAARAMLANVLAIQASGDKAAADAFVAKYTRWDPQLHEAIAARIRAAQKYRYTLYHYAAE